jgi:hypothetical protein
LLLASTALSSYAVAQSGTPPAQVDSFLAKTVRVAPNREPVIAHPDQDAEVAGKLAKARERFGMPPNIVMILFDDVGWGDIGVFGGGEAVGSPTPNIDRLAANGLRLTSAYSQPSCTPTRASLLTGRLPVRSGLLTPFLPGENTAASGLNGEVTLAEQLKKAGYTTQAVGKWHPGAAAARKATRITALATLRHSVLDGEVLDPRGAGIDEQAAIRTGTVNDVVLAGIASDHRARPLQGRQIGRQGDIVFENDFGIGRGARCLDRSVQVNLVEDVDREGRGGCQKHRKRGSAQQRQAPMR